MQRLTSLIESGYYYCDMAKRNSSRKKYQLYDDKNFILIAGGGFVVIVLMFMITGNMGFLNRAQKSEASVEQAIEKFVTIDSYGVVPQVITVSRGTTITWTNNDLSLRTIVAEDGSFNTGNLNQGESGSVAFDKIGTFEYYDQFNPDLQGSIVVE